MEQCINGHYADISEMKPVLEEPGEFYCPECIRFEREYEMYLLTRTAEEIKADQDWMVSENIRLHESMRAELGDEVTDSAIADILVLGITH